MEKFAAIRATEASDFANAIIPIIKSSLLITDYMNDPNGQSKTDAC